MKINKKNKTVKNNSLSFAFNGMKKFLLKTTTLSIIFIIVVQIIFIYKTKIIFAAGESWSYDFTMAGEVNHVKNPYGFDSLEKCVAARKDFMDNIVSKKPDLYISITQCESVMVYYYEYGLKLTDGTYSTSPSQNFTTPEECEIARKKIADNPNYNPNTSKISPACLTKGEAIVYINPGTNTDKPGVTPGVYTLLAPIGNLTTAPDNMGDYFNTIFTLAIGLCGVLAVIMIVIGGVQYMGDESIFGKTEAKSRITSAVLGLLIALGSYALLNTINPDLLGKGGIKINSVSAVIDPEVHGDTPQAATNGKYCNGKYTTGDAWASDQTERAAVIAAGITINAPNCTKVGQAGCTSLAGLNTSGVIGLKSKCGGTSCELIITGGTECWLHSNKTQHLPGNSIVDLRPTNTLVSYVDESKTKIPSSGMPFPVYLKDTTKFMRETNPDHYHIINW